MNKDQIIDSLAQIDDDMIQTVDALRSKKRSPVWLKWGALAACLCLVLAGVAMGSRFGSLEKIPEFGAGVTGEEPGGNWPDGVDPIIASVAVIPAGVDLKDVADAISISISEEDARTVEDLGVYIPAWLPDGCYYGKAAHYRTMMKDGIEYQMLRVTYDMGNAYISAPVPDDEESASEMTGNTAFLWMVWGHRPDTDRPVYMPEEVSASMIEQQGGLVFYINFGDIYVGIEKMDISTEDLLAIIESVG